MASIQSKLLEFWIRRMNLFGAEKIDSLALRARIEKAGAMSRPHGKVRVEPVSAGGVPAEWLIPAGASQERTLLYFHGGAWFAGSTHTHRAFVSRLAYASRVRALSINYRLAPEHPFPAGLDDCAAAYEWLLQGGIAADQIVVAGDSAGGNLTLALLVRLRDAGRPLPAAAVALSPATDLTGSGESHRTRAHLDPFFVKMGVNAIIPDYVNGQDPRNPLISPLYADLRGLPPLLLHVGEHETLLDDSVRFGERAAAAGVEVKTVVWPQMFHVFQIFAPLLPEASQAVAQIAGFISARLNGSRSNAPID
jgi:monoterpene epsilon-lactone hydrolase